MINFNVVEIDFNLKNKLQIKKWIKAIISGEEKRAGDITYIFCSDEYLGGMNKQYLNHSTLTDIITFDYSEGDKLSGDIFISVDRVKENSVVFNTSFYAELGRVMAHGLLHLSGYKDKTKDQKTLMRSKEDFCLLSYPNQ